MKVLYYSQIEPAEKDLLTSLLDKTAEIDFISHDRKDEMNERAAEFEILVGARIPREFLDRAANLKYFVVPFIGIPPFDCANLADFPNITVINSHFNSRYTAEHAISLMLASAKRIIPIHQKMKKGDWTPRYEHHWSSGLADKNLLLVGFGAIGQQVAKFASVFGMKIKAIKRTKNSEEHNFFVGTRSDLPSLLPDADFIILCLPGTEETKGILGQKEFELMKIGVHIVNVGRGSAIDENALYSALKSGKIGGAALDTWWNYPKNKEARTNTKPANVSLEEFDNVIFSPHRASHVEGREIERIKDIADIITKIINGNPKNIVNISNGY